MLGWDVLVLNGYLMLNFACGFYYLFAKYSGTEVNKKIFMPLIYISIVWALSIHTVTAFLIATMPARPDVAPQHDADPLHRDSICSRPVSDHFDLPHHPQQHEVLD
jgi:hypothetical protein